MPYTVFFKEANQVSGADNFINDQPIAHQGLLKSIADELAERGTISHPQASKNSKGDWSILVNDNGGVYVYTLLISKFEMGTNNEVKTEIPQNKRTLVIVDPLGPRDTVGGYHPAIGWPKIM